MRRALIFAATVAVVAVASSSPAAGGAAGGAGTAGSAGAGSGMATPGGAAGGSAITGPQGMTGTGAATQGQRTEQYQHETGEKARSMERQLQDADRGPMQGESLPSPSSSRQPGSPVGESSGGFDKPVGEVEKDVDRLEKR